MFQKCSWPNDKQWIEFSGGTNYRSKNRSDFSGGANNCAKIRDESSNKANHHSKNCADQNNRCHENEGNFRRNIVSSEISSKSQEFRRNSFALVLHSTVPRTFALGEDHRNLNKVNSWTPFPVIIKNFSFYVKILVFRIKTFTKFINFIIT